ncbi:hypothetical protein BJ742DRAFT_318763 [Cladochytrium replicatum]|nr:hypothetical protein BJ742DRAFT_318763 [Cladochytrium replicatum]
MSIIDESLLDFCRRLPKIELHAHLNGSLSPLTIQHLAQLHSISTLDRPQLPPPPKFLNMAAHPEAQFHDFFPLFSYIHQLTADPHALRIATERTIAEFASDGVVYLELRTTPRSTPFMTRNEYVGAVQDGICAALVSSPSIIVRLILSIDRRGSLETAMDTVALAEQNHVSRGGHVVGVDLCGDPAVGHFSELKAAFDLAKRTGIKVTLHLGELDSMDEESRLMLSMDPDRLGHCTFIAKDVRDQILEKKIPVEICVTSNLVGKTVTHIDDHHIKDLLMDSHSCVICTDDSGVFDCALSSEFYSVASAYSFSRQRIFTIAMEAVNSIFDNETSTHQNLLSQFDIFAKSMGLSE